MLSVAQKSSSGKCRSSKVNSMINLHNEFMSMMYIVTVETIFALQAMLRTWSRSFTS
jgi:hypothetical protein